MLPRPLIFDDVFGRIVPQGRSSHRKKLCAHFLLSDATDDTSAKASKQKVIHPAAKLATGNRKLTASKAADLFKRLLGPMEDELDGDLREAYQTALRLRPKSARHLSTSNAGK